MHACRQRTSRGVVARTIEARAERKNRGDSQMPRCWIDGDSGSGLTSFRSGQDDDPPCAGQPPHGRCGRAIRGAGGDATGSYPRPPVRCAAVGRFGGTVWVRVAGTREIQRPRRHLRHRWRLPGDRVGECPIRWDDNGKRLCSSWAIPTCRRRRSTQSARVPSMLGSTGGRSRGAERCVAATWQSAATGPPLEVHSVERHRFRVRRRS